MKAKNDKRKKHVPGSKPLRVAEAPPRLHARLEQRKTQDPSLTNGHVAPKALQPSAYREITPPMAMRLLENVANIRPVNDERVEILIAELERDNWHENNDAIVLNSNGAVINGQHRLWACTLSGKPIRVLLVEGIDDDTTMDMGKPRMAADYLSRDGMRNTRALGGTLKILENWRAGWRSPRIFGGVATVASMRETLMSYPSAPEFVNQIIVARHLIPSPLGGFVWTAGAAATNKKLANEFWDVFINGLCTEKQHPALQLRERMIRDRSVNYEVSSRGVALTRFLTLHLAMKAWNAYVNGERMGKLQIPKRDPNGPQPDLPEFAKLQRR